MPGCAFLELLGLWVLGVRSLCRYLLPRMWDPWAFDSGSQVVMSLSCFEEGFVLRCELSAAWGLCTRCRFSIWGLYLQVVWCFWVIRSSVFLLRGFSTRLVSVQSGSEVSLRDVKYLCNSHLFLSWRPCSVCRLFVAVCLVSVVFEGLRLKLWALCADTQWPVFGVSGYLSELCGVVVLEIKPLAFLAVMSLSRNWGFGSWQIWFWSLEPDMLTVCC